MDENEENKENVSEETRQENRELCERYPFLIPWNRWSGKLITDCANGEDGYWTGNPTAHPKYNYEYTELDNMPDGWRKAFGIMMCEELRDELIRVDDLDRWRILELKEKYGMLRLYDNGHKADSKIGDIINKYEQISERRCVVCGKPATRVTTGWISPFCDACCIACNEQNSTTIDEWLGEINDGKDDTGH